MTHATHIPSCPCVLQIFAKVLGMTVDVETELRYDRKPAIFWSDLKVVVLVVG